jgi:hypothetical protein
MPYPGAIGNFGQLGTAISGSGTGTPNFGSYIPTFQGPASGYNADPFLSRAATPAGGLGGMGIGYRPGTAANYSMRNDPRRTR